MSRYKPKGRPRSFDYDEAKRLRREGLTYAEIGQRLGVSANSIARACDPAFRKRQNEKTKQAIEAAKHPCFGGCGVLVWGHQVNRPGRTGYCAVCLGERRNVVKHGTETEYAQGCRCHLCTATQTEARRRRRHAARLPCSHGCGALVDTQSRRKPDKPLECRSCALRRVWAERRAAKSAALTKEQAA